MLRCLLTISISFWFQLYKWRCDVHKYSISPSSYTSCLVLDGSIQFLHMIWSPKSPDMNTIKHIWTMKENAVGEWDPAPTTTMELWVAIREAWLNISPLNFIELPGVSMPRRVAAFYWNRDAPRNIREIPMTFGISVYTAHTQTQTKNIKKFNIIFFHLLII